MSVLALVALVATQQSPIVVAPPVLWLTRGGEVEVAGQPAKTRVTPGATRVQVANGYGYDFAGGHGGILLEDMPELQLTGSMTVSVWLNLRSYVNTGPGAQVLFRGDDRNGLDPYELAVHSDGKIYFGLQDSENHASSIGAEIPLKHWTHILASFDTKTGALQMWVNREHIATGKSILRPFQTLDAKFAPGVGIGNVQNDHGPHNQPLDGTVFDLRLYDQALTPTNLNLGLAPSDNPPPLNLDRRSRR